MKKNLMFHGMIFLVILIGMTSCKKPLPTVDFTFVVDGSEVTFTSTVTETTDYSWDFGDESLSTEASPVHSYVVSGTYTVTLTATGPGGDAVATHDVEILPSFDEMLTGGPTAVNGKTWVLSREYTAGIDGGSAVEPSLTVLLAAYANVLDSLSLGSDEYDNEFTFYSDGKYEIDPVNDTVLTAALFTGYGGEVTPLSTPSNWLGLVTSTYTVPENATWTLHDEDFTVTSAAYLADDVPAIPIDVTFTGLTWLSFSEGAYFGILDFPTTRRLIIKNITPDRMDVAFFICAYWADPAGSGNLPNIMYHLTYVPKD